MNWTREHPEPPSEGEKSEWYWFLADNEKQPVVAEIWPNRGWWRPGWWGDKIQKPKKLPKKEE